MGRRDDNLLDDERADVALRQLLARAGEPSRVPPPPDLVARTARRLPAEPPARAARRAARRRAVRLAIGATLLCVMALPALVSLLDTLGGGSPFGLLFGDGAGGLSRALLALHLLAKPLLWTVGSVGAPLLLAACLAACGAGWLWWWLLRRTPAYAFGENAP